MIIFIFLFVSTQFLVRVEVKRLLFLVKKMRFAPILLVPVPQVFFTVVPVVVLMVAQVEPLQLAVMPLVEVVLSLGAIEDWKNVNDSF